MTRLLAVLAVGLLTAVGALADDVKKDATALQGTWDLALDKDQQITQDPELSVVIEGDKITVRVGEATTSVATFKLDQTTKPKQINLTFTQGTQKGGTYKGIYELDGTSLQVCYGKERPAAFANTKGVWLWLLQRHPDNDATAVVRDLGTVPAADYDARLARSLSALLRANPDDRVAAVEARVTLTEGKSLAYVRFLYDRDKRLLLVLMRTATAKAEGGNFYHLQSYEDTDPGSFQRCLPVRGQKFYPKVSQSSKKAEVVIPVKYAAFPKLSEWP